MGEDRFKHESLQDGDSIVRYISALADGFREGALYFSTDDKHLVLKPQGLVRLEVEAKKRDQEIKLALKFRWTEESSGDELTMGTLVIGAPGDEPDTDSGESGGGE